MKLADLPPKGLLKGDQDAIALLEADLKALGAKMFARKEQLMKGNGSAGKAKPAARRKPRAGASPKRAGAQ